MAASIHSVLVSSDHTRRRSAVYMGLSVGMCRPSTYTQRQTHGHKRANTEWDIVREKYVIRANEGDWNVGWLALTELFLKIRFHVFVYTEVSQIRVVRCNSFWRRSWNPDTAKFLIDLLCTEFSFPAPSLRWTYYDFVEELMECMCIRCIQLLVTDTFWSDVPLPENSDILIFCNYVSFFANCL